jgi:UDP-galactopyranose mutase
MNKFLIVGSGFSGAVIARELAEHIDCKIDIIEKRSHIAGNCFTESDPETGITVHKYGSHIFHTSNTRVWEYIQKYCTMRSFINRPKAYTNGEVYSMPINLHTINQFFGTCMTPLEAEKFIEDKRDKTIINPINFEQQALAFMGKELYEAFFYGYTKKHWGRDPKEIPASVLKRLPLRFSYNDNYYRSVFQGIPEDGYTEIIERILLHPNISIHLNTEYHPSLNADYDFIFYTGPLDAYYDHQFGRLSYRTVYWDKEVGKGDLLGHPAFNFPSLDQPYTRRREHKHYKYWESYEQTVVFTEYSKDTTSQDEPYYPMRLESDKDLMAKYYRNLMQENNVAFLGRLALYKYMDMHQVIADALDLADAIKPYFAENKIQGTGIYAPPSRMEEINHTIKIHH